MDELSYLSEATVGEQQRRAVVVVGRFQPPTAGHYALLDQVKKYIRDNPDIKLDPIPIVVVVDGKKTGKDKTKNPLSANERISFMTGSGKANGVKFLSAPSAFEAFEAVRKAGFEPIVVAAGSDRAEKYKELLNKYFKDKSGNPIVHAALSLGRDADSAVEVSNAIDKKAALDDILQYMGDEIPANMVSASLARHAVLSNEPEKFALIVGLANKPQMAQLLFNKIKASMESTNGDS